MSEYNEINKEIRGLVNLIADSFDEGVNIFSSKRVLQESIYEYEKCKKKCRIAKLLVFVICAVIIYFHFRGIG